ncbi:TetR/AcrR family transcriptional regulator [Phytoactinopolyspora alkaliphila]|uniref:TetR/AcrR family transcriptional regulator n=1 Tax=Phytoactinopolyspora alkaliphila TaxID=1783498 RepID=A0A6N9YRX3_9ACTN|nr:TetR/AcrR family transcriptional regulator [Phytoactinopolyspora alkaliphila]NED97791.1 TetR/AcrR family transcriptional regulator [Phytoactinopolyspora alkaliphila]
MSTADTRKRLIDGAIETIREQGIAGTSARTIARAAGTHQSLVFYHFGSVHELLEEACLTATRARVAPFVRHLDQVTNLRQLLDLGRRLHVEEQSLGNVTVLAQLLAGAQADPRLATATAAALQLWIEPIERTLHRVLSRSVLDEFLDISGLARAVCAGFIGLELFEGIEPAGANSALEALSRLALLLDVVEDLGAIQTRALRHKLRASRAQG